MPMVRQAAWAGDRRPPASRRRATPTVRSREARSIASPELPRRGGTARLGFRFYFGPAAMQDRLGIAVRLRPSFEHQIARCLEGDGIIEMAGHRAIKLVALILVIDHGGHPLHRL